MNHRQNFLSVLNGQPPARIPWSPRLEIWYQANRLRRSLPARYANMSLRQVEQSLGITTPARAGRVYRKELRDVETITEVIEDSTYTSYFTPHGIVSTCYKQTKEMALSGIIGLEVETIIKGPQDYKAVEYIIEHTEIVPTYQEYQAYENEIGSDGFPIVPIGQDPWSEMLWELVGPEQLYYHLADYPDKVHSLFETLNMQAQKVQEVALQSPAKLFLHGEHFDSFITPPKIFARYMLPYFQGFARRLHAGGKWLACHADSDSSKLLELILQAEFDLAECFVTAPMARVTLEQARQVWGNEIIIWGGIPSIILCDPYTEQEFEAYIRNMLRVIAPGDAIILGVADNVVPEAKIERIERVSTLMEQIGQYPLRVEAL